MRVKCKQCKYEWETKSELMMVSCPSCGMKNKIRGELNGDEKSPDASNNKNG